MIEKNKINNAVSVLKDMPELKAYPIQQLWQVFLMKKVYPDLSGTNFVLLDLLGVITLSGQIEITKLCSKYQIAQTQYYRWRDQLLQFGYQAFETKNITKKEQSLENENLRLRRIIGDLTVELKKTERELKL